ncbi:membrane protein insertase YidC [Caldimonas thermodepolymerans]|uniref:membrane protein insertase YidC n=1 Tax=Caldimonas thermodepolymerans TaxID=215580 RepID=UPI0022364827|nr:membrane protein insertase YidC [Caldimonas thermodepolymerans]UZG44362.1 membrane protein insertase YidC [Caldimonas thermodepolymerans]
MTDMRRTILWMVFTLSLVLLWDAWNKHNGRPSMFSPQPPAASASAEPPQGTGSAADVPAPAAVAGATTGSSSIATQAAAGSPTERITLVTDVYRAEVDTQGGSLVRLELLKYEDQQDRGNPVVLMDRSAQRTYLAQSGLINRHDAGGAFPNHLSVMTALPGDRTLDEGENELQLTLESAPVNGLQYRKTYTFKRGDYAIGVKHEVINVGDAPREPQLYLQLVRDGNPPPGESSFYHTFTGPALYTEERKFHKIAFGDIEKGKAETAPPADNGWVAMVQHYFASAWLNNAPAPREFRAAKVANNLYSIAMVQPLPAIAPGETHAVDTILFAGPQEEKKLEALAPGLDLVKDYGWFTILSKPLFWLLDKLYGLLGNWGWAIVALVVLLKVAFYWLNAKAYASMAKMKAISPRIQDLRERYKDKPQQLQQEMMRIYREEKINPMGGCLPILIQIPVFIALYWVLLSSVEMRNAPWILWITDLSVKDPYYILPLLMTASTLLQTWLNPTPPDPVQARMMWIMPLIFSVMFFLFPAGLVLYWLTNNILSIAQQYVINKRLGVTK